MTAAGKREDSLVHTREPLNLEPEPRGLIATAITPIDRFYVRNHGPIPSDRGGWRLAVDGLVDEALDMAVEDLRSSFSTHEVVATLSCAGNRRVDLLEAGEIPGEVAWRAGAIGTASWSGVRLGDVLRAAGPRPEARHVELVGADRTGEGPAQTPFGGSIPLEKACSAETLLAWSMNGEPLAPVHGAPIRVVVPGFTGARSVKWLRRITVREAPSENHFQARAYRVFPADADPDSAPAELGVALNQLTVNSAIVEPADGERIGAAPVAVGGYAIAGGRRPVERVDVTADGGASWTHARFLDEPGEWTWRRWRAELDLGPGEHEILARAWDSAATQQVETARAAWNPKGYANNAWPRVRVIVGSE